MSYPLRRIPAAHPGEIRIETASQRSAPVHSTLGQCVILLTIKQKGMIHEESPERVMVQRSRAVSGPINIHCDHSDSMGARVVQFGQGAASGVYLRAFSFSAAASTAATVSGLSSHWVNISGVISIVCAASPLVLYNPPMVQTLWRPHLKHGGIPEPNCTRSRISVEK